MKKKLGYFQIHRVVSFYRGVGRMMQPVRIEPKEGMYRALDGKIEFPKRRRGEKFLVVYSTVHEQEF
jgi:hypothetical protein